MSIKDELIELRVSTGMNRKQFCDYFQIPYRTMTDWELGNRTMPDYLLRLMAYKVNVEKLNIPALRNRDSGVVETNIPDTETAFDWLDCHS